MDRKEELILIWDEINSYIEKGHLKGNGTDKTSFRNGLILATNIVNKYIHQVEGCDVNKGIEL